MKQIPKTQLLDCIPGKIFKWELQDEEKHSFGKYVGLYSPSKQQKIRQQSTNMKAGAKRETVIH